VGGLSERESGKVPLVSSVLLHVVHIGGKTKELNRPMMWAGGWNGEYLFIYFALAWEDGLFENGTIS